MLQILKKLFKSEKKSEEVSFDNQQSKPLSSQNLESPFVNSNSTLNVSQIPQRPISTDQTLYQYKSNEFKFNNAQQDYEIKPGERSEKYIESENNQNNNANEFAVRNTMNQQNEFNAKLKQEREEPGDETITREPKKRNLLEEYFKGDLEGIVLTEEFRQTFDCMENTADNLIITGKAGTGKSTLLKYFLVHTQKSAVALAPTGIAAINIGGDTIHRFFRFPPHLLSQDDISIRPNKTYENIDTLIIDEFSMVNANLIDAVDEMMRGNGKTHDKPFGGAQVIFFGDFFQLPPVIGNPADQAYFANEYGSPWFFSSKVFQRPDFKYHFIELQENHRQNDQQFMNLLDNMRLGNLKQEQLELLNSRFGADNYDVSEFPIMLVPTNKQSNDYNAYKLDEINSKEYIFDGKTEGDFPKDRYPTLPQLHLKIGSQVMTIVNNRNAGYVNGTIGKVVSIHDDIIQIEVDDREGRHTCDVEMYTWENFTYRYVPEEHRVAREKIGTFTQFPLKLAWSITVHKSQGLTFDAVILDIGGRAFAPGLTYVAVSRCRSLEGLRLHSRIRPADIKVDYNARRFYLDHS